MARILPDGLLNPYELDEERARQLEREQAEWDAEFARIEFEERRDMKKVWKPPKLGRVPEVGGWVPGPNAQYRRVGDPPAGLSTYDPTPETPPDTTVGGPNWSRLTVEQQNKLLHEGGVPDEQLDKVRDDVTRCRAYLDKDLEGFPGSTGGEVNLYSTGEYVDDPDAWLGRRKVRDEWHASWSAPYAPDWPDQIPRTGSGTLYPMAVSDEARGDWADAKKFGTPDSTKRVWMAPDEYLRVVDRMFTERSGEPISSQHVLRDMEGLEALSQRITNGEALSVPWLNAVGSEGVLNGQEGRHRAAAAVMAGVKEMPVDIALRHGGRWASYPELLPELQQKYSMRLLPEPEVKLEKRTWRNTNVGEATPLMFSNRLLEGFTDSVIDNLGLDAEALDAGDDGIDRL
jgi:hypothetical protein